MVWRQSRKIIGESCRRSRDHQSAVSSHIFASRGSGLGRVSDLIRQTIVAEKISWPDPLAGFVWPVKKKKSGTNAMDETVKAFIFFWRGLLETGKRNVGHHNR